MARSDAQFVCQSCGAVARKWAGQCTGCGEWNSLQEEAAPRARPGQKGNTKKGRIIPLDGFTGTAAEAPRMTSAIAEFDRVTGGGLVPGSAILIGGDPGIGKSTLLTQVTAQLANSGKTAVYITGEESVSQVRLRAQRLGLGDAPVLLGSATSVTDILATLDAAQPAPDIVVIDSIQTVFADGIESAPGTVSQVRAAAHELITHAKGRGAAMILVGHVTKDGQIAGPRVLEHMVDAVLYFEGDRGHQFRILRAVKNRFGATDEIGVFQMSDTGLEEVANPSALFMGDRDARVSGAAVLAGIEGTRPMLVEIEALVSPSSLGTPRRAVVGWDSARLSMVLAVLEARGGLSFAGHDVYLTVAGGLKVNEPAADMAAAAALASALVNRPLPSDAVFFGEVALSGKVRPVAQADSRLKEAAKLGFDRAVVAAGSKASKGGAKTVPVSHVDGLVRLVSDG